jgi:hydroxymethylbilane synthase
MANETLKLGTRGSLLARMQSQLIADLLEKKHPDLTVELILVKTTGDKIQDRPLADAGGKGLFTRELEQALLNREVDFAVHSLKDVPVTMPLVDGSQLLLASVPAREDARDVLAVREPVQTPDDPLAGLKHGAKVGTSSLRRRAQLLAVRPDLQIEAIRGNIDTRLRKLQEEQYDAIVLAFAGLRRSGLFNSESMYPLPLEQFLPAPAQAALGLQCRRDDAKTIALLQSLDDPDTHACADLERGVVEGLNGDCHSPIAAYASVADQTIHLRAMVAARDGNPPLVHAQADAPLASSGQALGKVLQSLRDQGAHEMLHPDR